jgi:hypothetical protein
VSFYVLLSKYILKKLNGPAPPRLASSRWNPSYPPPAPSPLILLLVASSHETSPSGAGEEGEGGLVLHDCPLWADGVIVGALCSVVALAIALFAAVNFFHPISGVLGMIWSWLDWGSMNKRVHDPVALVVLIYAGAVKDDLGEAILGLGYVVSFGRQHSLLWCR